MLLLLKLGNFQESAYFSLDILFRRELKLFFLKFTQSICIYGTALPPAIPPNRNIIYHRFKLYRHTYKAMRAYEAQTAHFATFESETKEALSHRTRATYYKMIYSANGTGKYMGISNILLVIIIYGRQRSCEIFRTNLRAMGTILIYFVLLRDPRRRLT